MATTSCMGSVLRALEVFCAMSGQQVSREKTVVHFSKNVPIRTQRELLHQSGFKQVESLGRYLGVPALGRAPKRQDFQYLVDMVATKLSGWKANQLSLAGRITLAKSVVEAIPIYPMMSVMVPKACLQEIQRLQCSFIWGDQGNSRKAHMLNWQVLQLPKNMGCLAMRDPRLCMKHAS